MTEPEIQERLDRLKMTMRAKGCSNAIVTATIDGIFKTHVYIGSPDWDDEPPRYDETFSNHLGLSADLDEADAWVATLKGEATRANEEWTAHLGKLISDGKHLKIKPEFMDPLLDIMQQRSANITEGPKG